MAIWNLGSINADMVYAMPHLPRAGETLAASGREVFLGGKGTNMSVAASRAAARVHHIGAVGEDGEWAVQRLLEYGVDTRHIVTVSDPTGQAVIAVDPQGENQIILLPGANHAVPEDEVRAALSSAQTGDILLFQNETNAQQLAAQVGAQMGLRVCYAAAPFDAKAVQAVLEHLDFLILNAVEAEQLQTATGLAPVDLPVATVVVTLGAKGALLIENGQTYEFPAEKVTAVDTTGAGDTFTGYLLAGLDRGMPVAQAMGLATRAAAIMVTRHGTADVIPDLKDVQSFGQ